MTIMIAAAATQSVGEMLRDTADTFGWSPWLFLSQVISFAIVALLLSRGWNPQTRAAVLLSASTAEARSWRGTLATLGACELPEMYSDLPGLLVIGATVAIAEQLEALAVGQVSYPRASKPPAPQPVSRPRRRLLPPPDRMTPTSLSSGGSRLSASTSRRRRSGRSH